MKWVHCPSFNKEDKKKNKTHQPTNNHSMHDKLDVSSPPGYGNSLLEKKKETK